MQYRWNVFKGIRSAIEQNEGGLDKFSQGKRGRHVAACFSTGASCMRAQGAMQALMWGCLAMWAGYKFYGLNPGTHEGKTGIWYREWAPGARVRASCRGAGI